MKFGVHKGINYHKLTDSDVVGSCVSCGRYLCSDCAQMREDKMSCRESCDDESWIIKRWSVYKDYWWIALILSLFVYSTGLTIVPWMRLLLYYEVMTPQEQATRIVGDTLSTILLFLPEIRAGINALVGAIERSFDERIK